jgi:DNA-binding MarR family transcriptional regulator
MPHGRSDEKAARRLMYGVRSMRGPLLPTRRRNQDRPLPRSLERWSGFVLIVAAHAIEERYAHEVEQVGISLRDFVLLSEIARLPGVSQAALAYHVGLGRSRVAEQLAVLDMAGYVSREMDYLDLRKRRLWISDGGQDLLERAAERITNVDNGWLSVLEPLRRSVFAASLRRLPPARTGRMPAI